MRVRFHMAAALGARRRRRDDSFLHPRARAVLVRLADAISRGDGRPLGDAGRCRGSLRGGRGIGCTARSSSAAVLRSSSALSIGLSFLVGIAAYPRPANDGADTRLARSGGARLARADRHPAGRCPGAARRLAPLGLDPRELEPKRGPDLPPRRCAGRPLPFTNAGLRPDGSSRQPAPPSAASTSWSTPAEHGSELDARQPPARGRTSPSTAPPGRSLPLRRLRRPPRRLGGFDRPLCGLPAQDVGVYRVVISLPSGRVARQVRLQAGPVRRRIDLTPGASKAVSVPVSGHPLPQLSITVDRADFVGAKTTPAARGRPDRTPRVRSGQRFKKPVKPADSFARGIHAGRLLD